MNGEENIEKLAENVHDAYLETCTRLGWKVSLANDVPYQDLSEDSKELDRATVRAVLAGIRDNFISKAEVRKVVEGMKKNHKGFLKDVPCAHDSALSDLLHALHISEE